jgi:hypothetical protein
MADESTEYGSSSQPHPVDVRDYRIRMKTPDSKTVLWENVSALMKVRYGKENLTALAKDAGFGPGTSTRIKQQETSVGIDVLDALARLFKLEPWQLLMPNLSVESPSKLENIRGGWPFSSIDRSKFLQLPVEKRALAQGYIERLIEEETVAANRRAA